MSDIVERLHTVAVDAYLTPEQWEVIEEAKAEIDRLRAIVDRLLVTGDGVRVIPEIDWVWNWCALDGGFWERIPCPRQEDWVSKCYSTREAAEAAARDSA